MFELGLGLHKMLGKAILFKNVCCTVDNVGWNSFTKIEMLSQIKLKCVGIKTYQEWRKIFK